MNSEQHSESVSLSDQEEDGGGEQRALLKLQMHHPDSPNKIGRSGSADRMSGGGGGGGGGVGVVGIRALTRFPKGVFFCLGNEFAERFSYYGMRAVLILYLISVHQMEPSRAKLFFHAFVSLAYFMPLIGSIVADGFLGRYRLILYVSIVYCLGHLLLTLGAVAETGSSLLQVLDFTGLLIIAAATGGIKPCVSAFAADQFPAGMTAERKQFFSFFYFSINVGALLSIVVTPLLRRHHCFGNDHCFPLAFGVPAAFMFTATLIFWAGTPFYSVVRRQQNVMGDVVRCVAYALRARCRRMTDRSAPATKSHWLDYASPKFDRWLIEAIKTTLQIVVLYIPVVFFWSLFDQLGSTWVLQADTMDGRVGSLTLLPDQMSVLNPLLIILLVPLLEGWVYPMLSRCNCLVRPLRRMSFGGMLAAVSFTMAGLLQLQIDKTAIVPLLPGYSRVIVVNRLQCVASISDNLVNSSGYSLEPSETLRNIDVLGSLQVESCAKNQETQFAPVISKGNFLVLSDSSPINVTYELRKTRGGNSRLYTVFAMSTSVDRLSIVLEQNGETKASLNPAENRSYVDVEPELIGSNVYQLYLLRCPVHRGNCSRSLLTDYTAKVGAADVLLLKDDGTASLISLIEPNSINILWQLPQYVVITLGEALFSITGLEFSYSEASPSMKSVLTAIWLLTTAFGNVIDMIISGSSLVKNDPSKEFFVYAGLMAVIMLIFMILARRYKPAQHNDDPSLEERLNA